jgi:FKBP-type peptidyl-prolyl cis-trans isomerase
VPSGLGYGEFGNDQVPVNTNLIYEVELTEVIKGTTELTQLTSDIQKIDAYLEEQTIEAVEDPSGIRYIIETPGTGSQLALYDKINISYSGKTLGSNTDFFNGISKPEDDFDSRVVDYIHGLIVGLQKLSKGGKATFYIPSGLGFGGRIAGNGIIPANSNLEYHVEVIDVTPQ